MRQESQALRNMEGESGILFDIGIAHYVITGAVFFVTLILLRLLTILPRFQSSRKTMFQRPVKTIIVFGSGGHTAEMILLLKKFPVANYGPLYLVLAQTDITSQKRVNSSQLGDLPSFQQANWQYIYRSREVKQSWFTTVFTTILSTLHSIYVVGTIRPELIICNGPGES